MKDKEVIKSGVAKTTEVTISEEDISKLMRGERPEGMDFEEFKLKRKALQYFLKKRKKRGIRRDDTV
jgi:hypothetical protein